MNCAICEDVTDEIHFGAKCCPACAAFFRRTVALEKVYTCARDGNCPLEKDIRCICRACRYNKCLVVGMDPKQVQPQRDGLVHKARSKRKISNRENIVERSISTELPMCSKAKQVEHVEPVMIKKLVKAYQELVHHRRIAYCATSLKTLFLDGDAQLELKPVNVDDGSKFHQTETALLVQYLKSMDPFKQLPEEQKHQILKCFLTMFCTIEGCHRTVKMGGVEQNRMICPDNSYIDLDNMASIYDESASVKIDGETAVRLFKPNWDLLIDEILKPMNLFRMDDAEFVAVSTIICWMCDPSIADCSEETKQLGKTVRNQLTEELLAYYAERDMPDPEVRLGNLLLLVPAVLQCGRVGLENFRMIKFFDLVSYDQFLDELFA